MSEISTHTFNKGMNQDLDKSMIDNQTSFEIRNFRLNTSDGGSTAVLENIEGTCSAYSDLAISYGVGVLTANHSYIVHSAEAEYYTTTYARGDDFEAEFGTDLTSGTVVDELHIIKQNHKVIGAINVRNQVVLFSTNNTEAEPSGGNSCIYKATMATDEEDGRFASFERIYNDDYNGATDLNFSSANPIMGIGRYETANIQKVYWVDGYNKIRYCNIENNLTTDGEVYESGVNTYFPIDRFEFIPDAVLPKATLTNIVSGNIDTGMIQYTYQMYIKNGSETAFAPLSNIIHVAKSDDFLSHSKDYKGGKFEEQVGKGFKITIDNSGNITFNRIRIIALHRKSINDIPTIRIAAEISIDSDTNSISYTDTGNAIGELILEELAIPDTNLFKAEALETKDGLLFAGSIEQTPFELANWDTRTYRFNYTSASGRRAKIEETDSSYYYVYGKYGPTKQGAGCGANLGDWEYFGSVNFGTDDTSVAANTLTDSTQTWIINELVGYTVYNVTDSSSNTVASNTGTVVTFDNPGVTVWDNGDVYWIADGVNFDGIDWSIPETADCINPFNDPDGEVFATVDAYKYQADGVTLGAEGKNLILGFHTEDFDITDRVDINYTGIGIESVADNESYKDYSSPWRAGQERSWQRDEVYRIGIVFYDNKMRKSQAFWSNDLKIPDSAEATNAYDLIIVDAVVPKGRIVYPQLKINSLPTDAVYYQMCRVQRSSIDRSILAQGLINRVGGGPPAVPSLANSTVANDGIFKLISPEIVINQNIAIKTSDYVEYIGNYGAAGDVPDTVGVIGATDELTYKSIEFNPVTKAANHKVTVTNASILSPMESTDTTMIGAVSVRNYNTTTSGNFTGAYGGTALFVEANMVAWVPVTAAIQWAAVNYRRNVFDSQYGGNTHEARTTNEYISASDLEIATGVWKYCKIGDTFITYFEYLNLIWDLSKVVGIGNSVHEVVFIPVESSINCNLRYDLCHSDTHSVAYNQLMQEFAGTHTEGVVTFEQTTDLYQYNTVYSEENDAIKFFALPYDYISVNEYDARVKVSNIKINGEATDSWTKFNVNEYIDVDSACGGINNLYLFKNYLMFFQDTGFGTLAVNERSLISDNNPGELVLGTGDILNRFDYVSKNIGNKQKLGLIESANSLYWFYDNEKALYRYSQSEMPLSKLKGMQSWFNNNFTNGDTVIGVYDDEYNEVIFTVGDSDTIVYNEMFDVFSAFYGFIPNIYVKLNNGRYISSEDNFWLFYHNYKGDVLKRFYNATATFHSTVKFLVADNYVYTKVFDNINYISVASYNSVQDRYNSTFNRLRVFNDYQNSDWVTLTPGTNLERRERNWALNVPRDIVKIKEEADTNIFLGTNLDDTQTFKKRMRDKYMQIELDYYNTYHHRFIVPLINTKYRISYR